MTTYENIHDAPDDNAAPPPGVHTMAILRWIIVGVMALAAVGAALYFFGVFEHLSFSSGTANKQLYYCPMHPSIVQDHPGECPICSMTLVPKPDSGGKKAPEPPMQKPTSEPPPAGGGAARPPQGSSVPGMSPVDLPPARVQLMGMKTARAERAALSSELHTVGYVAPNEKGLAQINTRFAGWIQQLFVNQTGERVSRGQVLATIYSPELLRAQEEYLNARKWAGKGDESGISSGLKDDSRKRLELLGISAKDIEALDRTGTSVQALAIRSPVDGYVIRKNALQGLYVQPGTELFGVADLSAVWVIADVYESEVQRIAVGQKATLKLQAYAGESFIGKVQFIYPTLDADSRTLKVRVEFKNRDLKLRPGMYGDVAIQRPAAEGVVVPKEAIVDTGEMQYLFVAKEGGHFEPRKIKLGAHSGDKVEVLEGVKEGELVVTTANFLVDSESRLRAAIEGEGATGGATPTPMPAGKGQGAACDADFDKQKFPDKYQQCRQCELVHRGMGTMEQDCKKSIPKPWK